MKKAEIFCACMLVLMFLYILTSGADAPVIDDPNVVIQTADEVEAVGHEVQALQEDMMRQEMRQEVILSEVKKNHEAEEID